jgi:hypothetical protein
VKCKAKAKLTAELILRFKGPPPMQVPACQLETATPTAVPGISLIPSLLSARFNMCKVGWGINQSINVISVAMKFIENSCQPFTENHLFS